MATDLAEQSLRDVHRLGDRLAVALGLKLMAWIAVTNGRAERAAVLFDQPDAMWQASSAPLAGFGLLRGFHDGIAATAHKVLGASAYRRAFEEGARMATAEAVRFALGSPAPGAAGGGSPAVWSASESKNPLTRREAEVAAMIVLRSDEQGDRWRPGHRSAHGRVPRPAHHGQALLHLPGGDRHLGADRGIDPGRPRTAHAVR